MLRPVIDRLAADVLCLQEVNGQKVPGQKERHLLALDRLLEGTRYRGYSRAIAYAGRSGVADVHNIVTLSRFPIVSQRQILHEFVPGSAPLWSCAVRRPRRFASIVPSC